MYPPSTHPASPEQEPAFDLEEFGITIRSSEQLIITGDFNIHVDDQQNVDSVKLIDLLHSMGLRQHVNKPTHKHGHTFDLCITRQVNSLIIGSSLTDSLFSDHMSVIETLRSTKPPITV